MVPMSNGILLIHLWMDICFHVLAIVNSAAMGAGMHVPFLILVLSGYVPRSGVSRSYGNSTFSLFEALPYHFP